LALGLRGHESDLGELRRCDDRGLLADLDDAGTCAAIAGAAVASASANAASSSANTACTNATRGPDVLLEQMGRRLELRVVPWKWRAVQHGLGPDMQL